GLLGILKAGGAYLPLDPDYPLERISFMLDDAAVRLVVTRSALRKLIEGHACAVIDLHADSPAIPRQDTTAPVSGLSPQNTAYVSYTSGSPGTPKGVAALHGNVVAFSQAQADEWSSRDTTLHNAPLAFDASTFEVWGPLLSGARLVLMPSGQ